MTDSIVLTIIHILNKEGQQFGLRTLVARCRLADKTISRSLVRLEAKGRLRVDRGEQGKRHNYEVLVPPNGFDMLVTAVHLASQKS